MKTKITTLLKTLLVLSCTSALHAAPITWGSATETTGKSNLIEGNIIHAWGGGAAATITNGGSNGTSSYTFSNVTYSDFTFAPATTGLAFADSSNGAASTGDVNMDSLLKTLTYTNTGTTTGTQTISGLTSGETYQIQIFFNDQRNSRSMTFGDGTTTVVVSGQGANWGQYVIGTFTTDATTQTITHATNGFGNLHVNAILITDAASTPSVTLTTSSQSVSGPYTVGITFSEAVTGLEESDFTVANGTIQASSLTGSGANWTVTNGTDLRVLIDKFLLENTIRKSLSMV
ncbi:MAG: Ig-like domain-containing protein, partial [Akkermansiaceae bacterium]